MQSILKAQEVREYISDYPDKNLLLDEQEFGNTFVELSMDLAVSEFNALTPRSGFTAANFPSKSLLMLGTLWQMYLGRATLMARNQLTYSDGGIQIPVEERYQLYIDLSERFRSQFMETGQRLKVSMNMEAGWGEIRSDESTFPIW